MADYEFAINLAGKPPDPANGHFFNELRAAISIGYQNDLVDYDQIDPNNPQEGLDYQRHDPLVVVCDEKSCTLDPSTGKLRALDLYAHAGHYGEWDGTKTLTHGASDGFATDMSGRMTLPWRGLYTIECQLHLTLTHTLDAQNTPGKGAIVTCNCRGLGSAAYGVAETGIMAVAAGTYPITTPVMTAHYDTSGASTPSVLFGASFSAYAWSDDGSYTLTIDSGSYIRATWIAPPSDEVNHPYYEIPS